METIKPIFLFGLLSLGLNHAVGQGKPIPANSKDTALVKVDSLKAAIVTAIARPHIKGDTIEFNTQNIRMPPNAAVEELLRRLPGLQIDPDGTITYNGQKIDHLLVDGQDIFGSNPTMVTRNFNASKIARIQILDRKSDQAIFTGVDDGVRTKTLNLVLKESAKDGYFGKIQAGGNQNAYYNVSSTIAAFREKEQLTFFGLTSNTGGQGITTDNGPSTEISLNNAGSDPLGGSAGIGIPHITGAALHYANDWNGPQDHLSTNYQFNHYYTQPFTSTTILQEQPNSLYLQSQNSQSTNLQDQYWLYADYDIAPTPRTSLKFTLNANLLQAQNQFSALGKSYFGDTLTNSSQRTIQDQVSKNNIDGYLYWRTQIGNKIDRLFSIVAHINKTDNITNGYLYSLDRFYQNGLVDLVDTVDQRKQLSSHPLRASTSIAFSEPLGKHANFGIVYAINHLSDDPIQATYLKNNGKYNLRIDSLSTYIDTRTTAQLLILNLQGKLGRLGYTIGNTFNEFAYKQKDLIADTSLYQHYYTLAPKMLLNFTPEQSSNISISYNATTQQPGIAQLSPIVNNSDPLHISMGNPFLKPATNQNVTLDFHRFRSFVLNLSANMAFTSNAISTKVTTDSMGRQISQPVNINGGKATTINFSVNKNMLGLAIGLHTIASYTKTVSYVTALLNNNDSYTAGVGFSANKYVPDKFSFQLTTNFTYLDQQNSTNPSIPLRYWSQNHQASLTVYLVKNFELGTNGTYTWQEKTSALSASTSVTLWNTYVSRNFIHNSLVIRFQLNNILDANAGITRSTINNITTQSSTNILGRYCILSAIYHFDRNFKKAD